VLAAIGQKKLVIIIKGLRKHVEHLGARRTLVNVGKE
jgi:hypothetical protein